MNYADISDEAAAREQHMIDVALANRQHPSMPFTGACYWCDDNIEKGNYCCAECREDDEKDKRAKQQRAVA